MACPISIMHQVTMSEVDRWLAPVVVILPDAVRHLLHNQWYCFDLVTVYKI